MWSWAGEKLKYKINLLLFTQKHLCRAPPPQPPFSPKVVRNGTKCRIGCKYNINSITAELRFSVLVPERPICKLHFMCTSLLLSAPNCAATDFNCKESGTVHRVVTESRSAATAAHSSSSNVLKIIDFWL